MLSIDVMFLLLFNSYIRIKIRIIKTKCKKQMFEDSLSYNLIGELLNLK